MISISRTRAAFTSLCLLSALIAVGCASQHLEGFDEKSITVDESSALAGAALFQRKQEMQRAAGDVVAMYTSMEDMMDRVDRRSVYIFSEFIEAYMQTHLDPMLAPSWQSAHAELVDLDANLRVMKTAMLIQMKRPVEVKDAVEDIQRRYQGRGSLLINYPVGAQSTLSEVVALLEGRIDDCMSDKTKWGPGARVRSLKGKEQRLGLVCMGGV